MNFIGHCQVWLRMRLFMTRIKSADVEINIGQGEFTLVRIEEADDTG